MPDCIKLISLNTTSKYDLQMCAFNIEKCQVVWSKDSLPENDRQSIMKDLRKMSFEIQEAVHFTKKLSENKMNEVKFWLNTGTEIDYTLSIYYEIHSHAWGMLLEKIDAKDDFPKVVGEIACTDPMTFRFVEAENVLRTESLSGL